MNELLVGIDRLGQRNNVIKFWTSNLSEIIDSAFMSRVSIVQSIDLPGKNSIYEILRRRINTLNRTERLHQLGAPSEPRAMVGMESNSMGSRCRVGQLIPRLQNMSIMDLDGASWAVSLELFRIAEACVVR